MRTERAYLEHILHCIHRIREDASVGKDLVMATPTLQDAIVRNLQIMCESTQRLQESSKSRHPEVDWRGISGLRNVLVHSYFEVDLEATWGIVERDLAGLKMQFSDCCENKPDQSNFAPQLRPASTHRAKP